ncbi:zinc ribbon domain-containing protein [Halorubrum amylolyticum]|uniref:zinc ribbon domain-containing protein n=1 Tax=Halorubrum amylolyticum TaxID=2508724 RepID=UPI001008E9EF|nr:zinc ribbon domain-containing protein [Halorubrum amylolyticum]
MRDQFRPLLAALLAMALPGLGHLTLRRWGRALLWHLTIVGGGVALFALYDVPVGSTGSVTEAAETAAALPTDVTLPIAVLYGLSAVDAYLVGRADIAERRRADATAEAVRRRAASDDGEATAEPSGANAAVPVATDSRGDAGPTEVECPHCGKETDADLDFCHWCTEPLPWADAE